MIDRNLAGPLRELARHYPVVMVTGPRQSGKTTLCRSTFGDKPYVSLEPLDVRGEAKRDPRGFLDEHRAGAILDEVQHAADLLSYLQVEVDERPEPGRFILTGSQHFGLSEAISQSLAGRAGVLHLLPPSLDELLRFEKPPGDLLTTLWMGAYPRIHDRGVPADRWLADYVTNYVQRDVRQVLHVGDLEQFTTFLRLCAGRSACELNLSALGSDAGVAHNTARAWISVLETSFLVARVPPWRRNVRKQMIKAAKLHFLDSGLLCHLLGIHAPEQLRHHPLRGAIFESWVASELFKARANAGKTPDLFHYREPRGLEVDLLLEGAKELDLVEVKAGATVPGDALTSLERARAALGTKGEWRTPKAFLVFGGEGARRVGQVRILPWSDLPDEDWAGR
jgi:hypothetical protein